MICVQPLVVRAVWKEPFHKSRNNGTIPVQIRIQNMFLFSGIEIVFVSVGVFACLCVVNSVTQQFTHFRKHYARLDFFWNLLGILSSGRTYPQTFHCVEFLAGCKCRRCTLYSRGSSPNDTTRAFARPRVCSQDLRVEDPIVNSQEDDMASSQTSAPKDIVAIVVLQCVH